jgi:type IV pilus assembly protein PilN
MILINLLPFREQARLRRQAVFNGHLGLAALAGVLVVVLLWAVLQGQIASQQRRNALLRAELVQLDRHIREIAHLEAEILALRQRQAAVEALQADRNQPVHLLTELVRQLPEGLQLTRLKQVGPVVTLSGLAQSNERISQLLRNLRQPGLWLQQPQLLEIVAARKDGAQRVPDHAVAFSMTVQLRPVRPPPHSAKPVAAG